MRTHISRHALAALPPWARIHSAFYPDKRALKARSAEAMRARERRALDALRHGADPDAATLPTRSRDVADRWAFD
jgi:hypothetical protein